MNKKLLTYEEEIKKLKIPPPFVPDRWICNHGRKLNESNTVVSSANKNFDSSIINKKPQIKQQKIIMNKTQQQQRRRRRPLLSMWEFNKKLNEKFARQLIKQRKKLKSIYAINTHTSECGQLKTKKKKKKTNINKKKFPFLNILRYDRYSPYFKKYMKHINRTKALNKFTSSAKICYDYLKLFRKPKAVSFKKFDSKPPKKVKSNGHKIQRHHLTQIQKPKFKFKLCHLKRSVKNKISKNKYLSRKFNEVKSVDVPLLLHKDNYTIDNNEGVINKCTINNLLLFNNLNQVDSDFIRFC